MVAGICGGYQMPGLTISDPFGVDGAVPEAAGMGLLPVRTAMEREKRTVQVMARSCESAYWDGNLAVGVYEIHMGKTERLDEAPAAFRVDGGGALHEDGAISRQQRVRGVYLHGLFDSDEFRKSFLDHIRKHKGMALLPANSYDRLKQEGFNRLASIVRSNIDMTKLYQILDSSRQNR